jgi:hypothetical protein
MPTFKLGVILEEGVCEYLADCCGQTFFDACARHAASDPAFARDFDRQSMTFKLRRLVNLDAYFEKKDAAQPRLH